MKTKLTEVAFTPVDNQRLANLCGPLDENLRQIETALDVEIGRRGERFTIDGKPGQIDKAAEVLQRFYELSKQNLNVEDVQLGLIEIARDQAIEADVTDMPVLITRRADLRGRTPRPDSVLEEHSSARHHVRHRPCRHRQDLSRRGFGRGCAGARFG